jgi:DinB superfamily
MCYRQERRCKIGLTMPKTIALLTLAAASLLPAETITQHDREFAMSHLHATRKMFLDSVAGLTPEQWTFKAAPDRWSIAECAEHIAASEDFMFGLVANQVMKSPADPAKRAEVKGKDEAIVKQVPDRSQKYKAPDAIAPKQRWSTPEAIISHFKESRDHSIEYVDTTQDDLRDHFAPHPVLGALDGYQWILLMSAHSERHTEQINEVKADPKFPRK